jgi:hypothetical protein
MQAHPSCAANHYAIKVMMDDVDEELRLCHRLNVEKPFQSFRLSTLPHRWDLADSVDRVWRPHEEDGQQKYEFIDGTFRPDTRKLLELLAGTQLYVSELAAVRELLQNAFDAVLERIARQHLDPQDPAAVD